MTGTIIIGALALVGAYVIARRLWEIRNRYWFEYLAHRGRGPCICGEEGCTAFPRTDTCATCGRDCGLPTMSRRAYRHLGESILRDKQAARAA